MYRHPEFHKVKDGGLAGAIMVSGIYDLTATPLGETERAYFGTDPSRYAERSSLQDLATKRPADDGRRRTGPARLRLQFDLMKQATCKRASGCARTFNVPQHSHMSEVYAINTADTRLTDDILDFVKTGK